MINRSLFLIIGNGFDISHNLKTKYSDFAEHYIKEILTPQLMQGLSKAPHIGTFFSEEVCTELDFHNILYRTGNFESDLFDVVYDEDESKVYDFLKLNYENLGPFLKNKFLAKLFSNHYMNWFDIEDAYFQDLVILKDSYLNCKNRDEKIQVLEKVRRLNLDLNDIKIKLSNYLKLLDIQKDDKVANFFSQNIKENYNGPVYVINFNYTETIEKYITELGTKRSNINYIHGSLNTDAIIFGYGNDMDVEYRIIKDLGVDDFFENFKTFNYLDNNKYAKIHEEIDFCQEYDIIVLGHSLSLTDKTLLDELVNCDKCKKINILKRSDLKDDLRKLKESYRKQVYSASRILSEEREARRLITNFEDSLFFP